jgi:putative Mg2+ transporter-C (MgtC) family protein
MELFNSLGYNIFLNLSLAVILGMIIGGERLYAHKTASMRTYAMVAMGAALFVTIAILGGQLLSSSYSSINPMYVVAQIISGIGFLGDISLDQRPGQILQLDAVGAGLVEEIHGLRSV